MNAPPAIPDHTLLRPIGRGAYGEVWLARNVMGVLRAVKIVERRQFDSSRPYEREFAGIQRYEPVSRLADGLVHVLHVGRNDDAGYFYYVMELADDANAEGPPASGESPATQPDPASYAPRTLRSDLKRMHRLPIADCVRAGLDVVSGLAKLHEQGLVHRDVKPGNIIFVNSRAKLADIGLVSRGGEGRTFVGTEGYIPPEGPGSVVADIYALGMALYEAATGYSPERFPQVPKEWFADDAGPESIEFQEVILKSCEGARERRYQGAEELQADLALLQSGQSVRRVRQLERRAARTQRLAWVSGAVVAVAITAALAGHWRARIAEKVQKRESALLHEAREARERESEARGRAEYAERDARRQLDAARFEQARALVLSKEIGHRTRALAALREAKGSTNMAELRRVAFAALSLPDLRLDREESTDVSVTLLQPDPSFGKVATARGTGPVSIHSMPEGQLLGTLPACTNRDAYVGVWSADSRFLAIKRQHDYNGIRSEWEVWDLEQTNRVLNTGPDAAHSSVTFHPTRPLFMAGYGRGRTVEWDLKTGKAVRTFAFPNTPHVLAYSPDGRQFVACYRVESQWTLAFHDAETLAVLKSVDCPEPVEIVAWHPSGRWVTCTGIHATDWTRRVHVVEAATGTITSLGEHKVKTALGEFIAGGDFLVTGGWDREIAFWDLHTRRRAFSYAGTGYRSIWDASGRHCIVVLGEPKLQHFTFVAPHPRNLSGNNGEVPLCAFSPDGRWLAARSGQELSVWDLRSTAPAATVPAGLVSTIFFSPDNTEIFASGEENSQKGFVARWRVAAGANENASPTVEPLPMEAPNGVLRIARAATNLVMTGLEGVRFAALRNSDVEPRRAVSIAGGQGYVSPDGRWLAMVYHYSTVVGVFQLPEVKQVARLQTSHYVGSVTFSHASDEMLVLNRSGAEWFDTRTWQCSRRQPGVGVSGSYAFYTPDDRGIWMVTHFRNAALVDRQTLKPILPLPSDVLPLAVTPDGRQLAASVEGRRVQLWDFQKLRHDLAELGLDW